MVVSSCFALHARDRDGTDCIDDRVEAENVSRVRRQGKLRPGLIAALWIAASPVAADPIRIATFNTELQRDGPGLFLRDVLKGEAADIEAAARLIASARADVIVLQGIDYDYGGMALGAFAKEIEAAGAFFQHRFQGPPNAGLPTTLDLDGDGYLRGPRDAEGFGTFSGQGGMAVLSRWPLDLTADFSGMRWADLPGNLLADNDPGAYTRRLSSVAHWVLRIAPETTAPFTLLTMHASPPVFDGPEDLNGRRNHDEAAVWLRVLDGTFDVPMDERFALLGDFNADPLDGDGRRKAIAALLSHPALKDAAPASDRGRELALADGGANASHRGDSVRDTANWNDDGPGNLRVDYVLPSAGWTVLDAGVLWSDDTALRHGLVWVDLAQ